MRHPLEEKKLRAFDSMSQRSYWIADTAFGIDGSLNSDTAYQLFLDEDRPLDACLKVIQRKHMPFQKQWLDNSKDLFWSRNEEGLLTVSVYNTHIKQCYGTMDLSADYKVATVNYHQALISEDYDVTEVLLFLFFQIRLLFTPGLILHAAAVEWQEKGILFSAPSETGKTTQAKLWINHLGAAMINGDRPALTLKGQQVYVHGTPWSGSDPTIRNVSVPAAAIVLIEQAPVNEVVRLTPQEALLSILPRVFIPYYDDFFAGLALDHLDKLLAVVPIYKLKCRPDQEAVAVVRELLIKDKCF